jgi:GTP-binding protein LepA
VLYDITRIRNVGIVAHIDHGKSTLADRLIELGSLIGPERNVEAQRLDNLSVERQRGITVRAQSVRLSYDGVIYNVIDTPGHVDFSYEVGRALSACEGILLVVDATQGIEAQTLAHIHTAQERGLVILPVLNKIDLFTADVESVSIALEEMIGVDRADMVHVSAKTGAGVPELFRAIERMVPGPAIPLADELQALLIDSWYDNYYGVVMLVRVVCGEMRANEEVRLMSTGKKYRVNQVGVFLPKKTEVDVLRAGEIGYLLPGIRDPRECCVGDTVTHAQRPCAVALPGFQKCVPVVFCGIFPEDTAGFEDLEKALEKLNINDSSFTFERERSVLGMGFRCGFLGILHLEVITQRLEEEFDQEVVLTIPSVSYSVRTTDGKERMISNPTEFPEPNHIKEVQEPWILGTVFTPHEYVGMVMELCISKRGVLVTQEVATGGRTVLVYEMPLSEIVFDFHDQLKLKTKGYASFDYKALEYRSGAVQKVQILINGNAEDSLSAIVHKDATYMHGRRMCETLKEHIPRQNIVVKIQAALGGKIIASEQLQAYRKDVTAKLYGGDRTRRDKLLKKQKKGKARMQRTGAVHVPNEAYIAVMRPKMDK